MKACHTGSSDDLTIILPRSEVCALRKSSARISTNICSSTRSQGPVRNRGLRHEKRPFSVRNQPRPRRQVVGAMAVLALALGVGLTAAATKAAWPTRLADKEMAKVLAEQSQPPEEALAIPAAQYPCPRNCKADTTYGTAVNFLATPAKAASEARRSNKLTFLLHISGNFEDSDFT